MPKRLHNAMLKLLNSNQGDLEIISTLDNGKIKVIKSILINITPYFNITKNGLDSANMGVALFKNELLYLLRFIYTQKFESIKLIGPVTNKFRVLDIARMWCIDELVINMSKQIESDVSDANQFEILRLADEMKFEKLRDFSIAHITSSFMSPQICYDEYNEKDKYRYCCYHTFIRNCKPHHDHCYYNTTKNKPIPENAITENCCLHRSEHLNLRALADESKIKQLRQLSQNQLADILTALVDLKSFKHIK
jgi:hypothetical protein